MQEIENEGETPRETQKRMWWLSNFANPVVSNINYACDHSKETAEYLIETVKQAGLDAYEQINKIVKGDK